MDECKPLVPGEPDLDPKVGTKPIDEEPPVDGAWADGTSTVYFTAGPIHSLPNICS